jgi:hypothetical protein
MKMVGGEEVSACQYVCKVKELSFIYFFSHLSQQQNFSDIYPVEVLRHSFPRCNENHQWRFLRLA